MFVNYWQHDVRLMSVDGENAEIGGTIREIMIY